MLVQIDIWKPREGRLVGIQKKSVDFRELEGSLLEPLESNL